MLCFLLSATPASFSITSSGDFTSGSEFQLTCTVAGVTPAPSIFWLGPEGLIMSSTDDVQLGDTVVMGNTYSRTLVFKSLSPGQAGTYICFNTATSPYTIVQEVFLGSKLSPCT